MSDSLMIVDYGIGNFHSLQSALTSLNLKFTVDTDGSTLDQASILILPGVAAFGACVECLKLRNQLHRVSEHLKSGKKLLGICIGAQLMSSASEEAPGVSGLGQFSGRVKKLDVDRVRVPNQGWYQISAQSTGTFLDKFHDRHFYFSHSYKMVSEDFGDAALATINFADTGVVAAFVTRQLVGIQFHPEKSGKKGLEFIRSAILHLDGS